MKPDSYAKNGVAVHSAYDVRAVRKKLSIDEAAFVIGAVGRFVSSKRFMMTLDDAVDLVLHAFENGKNGDEFYIRTLEIISTNNSKCKNIYRRKLFIRYS